MATTNTYTAITTRGAFTMTKSFLDIDASGRTACKPLYSFGSREGLSKVELLELLVEVLESKREAVRHLRGLEDSNLDAEPTTPRRVSCGAPTIAGGGLPVRPLAYA